MGDAVNVDRRQPDVLDAAQMFEQAVKLEHHADPGAQRLE